MTLNVAPYLREDTLLVPLVGKKSKCAAHTGKQLGEKREQRTVDEGTRLFFSSSLLVPYPVATFSHCEQ